MPPRPPAASGHLIVDAYAGYKGEETPRAFVTEGRRVGVTAVLRRWYTERHACFRVRADDHHTYVLRYDLEKLVWELVMQEPPDTSAGASQAGEPA